MKDSEEKIQQKMLPLGKNILYRNKKNKKNKEERGKKRIKIYQGF